MSASENARTAATEQPEQPDEPGQQDQPDQPRQPEPHSVIPNIADLSDARKYRALAVCLLVGFMTLLDVSIVNVALPSMQKGLHATPADLRGSSPDTPSPSA